MMNVKVERQFQIPNWDAATKQKAVNYWSRRRFAFSETSGDTLSGKRGSLIGNLISFDMSNLLANLSMTATSQGEVNCLMSVNTAMQQITEYNKLWWELEMETFESFLVKNDEQEEKWKKFKGVHKKSAWTWAFTWGTGGNKIKPEDTI